MGRNYEITKKDVGANFQTPQDILASKFDHSQKIDLLKQWELDVREKMVAEEEGMTGTRTATDGALLQSIQSCLSQLGAEEQLTTAANKAGGGMEALQQDAPSATD